MNKESFVERNSGWISLLIGALVLFFGGFGGLVWAMMTVGLVTISFFLAEVGNYESADPYAFMAIVFATVLFECGFSPVLLGNCCNPQLIAWIGAIGALAVAGNFLFRVEIGIKEVAFAVLLICFILLWHYYPASKIWDIYFWTGIVILSFAFILPFLGVGTKLITLLEKDCNLAEVSEAILIFCACEIVGILVGAFLFEWSWLVGLVVLGIGVAGVVIGFLGEYHEEFKKPKNKNIKKG